MSEEEGRTEESGSRNGERGRGKREEGRGKREEKSGSRRGQWGNTTGGIRDLRVDLRRRSTAYLGRMAGRREVGRGRIALFTGTGASRGSPST